MNTILRLSFAFLLQGMVFLPLWGQPESKSPYSSQAYDPVANPAWYQSPFLWLGLVVFLLVLIYILRRNRRRSETYMGPGE